MRSSPVVRHCLFVRNESGGGGAIAIDESSEPLLIGCEIRDNSAIGIGGGIVISILSKPTIVDCDIHDNTAGDGGGIATENASAMLDGCSIHHNLAGYGGGIALLNGFQFTALDTEVADNDASQYGGGIYAFQSTSELTGCGLARNHAEIQGGAGWLYESESTLLDSRVFDNSATGSVGGLHLDSYSYITVQSSELCGNGLALHIDAAPGRPLDARFNWWGDPSGPYHPTGNPAGLGDAVGDHIDFVPWNTAAAIQAENTVPAAPRLALANPVHGASRISVSVPHATHARLRVFDVQGRRIAELLDRQLDAGRHVVDWDGTTADGRRLHARVVFLQLELDDVTLTRKATLID